MNDFSSYDSIVMEYCSNPKKFIREYPSPIGNPTANILILSLKKKFAEYKNQAESIDISGIDMKSIDSLFLLEGRIHYLANASKKQVFSKKTSPKREEFIAACNDALAIYPYAFFASKGLSRLYEIHGKPKEAYELLKRVWERGFKTNLIVDALVFLSVICKDWKNAKKYPALAHPLFFRLFLDYYLFTTKYKIYFITNLLTVIIILIIKPWLIVLSSLFLVLGILHISAYLFKSRVIYVRTLSGLFQLFMLYLFKLIVIYWIGDFVFKIYPPLLNVF